jgi:hypothetical protein
VTFTDNHDGTATIAGTPTVAGAFPITVKASNGASTDATQSFTLTVTAPPKITSANTATFTSNIAGQSFTVTTAAGYPAATTITETGALPSGVTFTDNGNGTATIAGTPTVSTSTNYVLTIKASNGTSPDATQSFTLKVTKAVTRFATSTNSTPEPGSLQGSVPLKAAAVGAPTTSLTSFLPATSRHPQRAAAHTTGSSAAKPSGTAVPIGPAGSRTAITASLD